MKLLLGFLSIITATVCDIMIPSAHMALALSIPLSVLGVSLIYAGKHE